MKAKPKEMSIRTDLYFKVIIAATFSAIAHAMGWDRECPDEELLGAVKARLNHSSLEVINNWDRKVRKVLSPDYDEVDQDEVEGGK